MAVSDLTAARSSADFLVTDLVMYLIVFFELEALGSLSRKQLAALEQTVDFRAVGTLVNCVLDGDNGHCAVVFRCACNAVGDDPVRYKRTRRVVDDNNIGIGRVFGDALESVVNGVLTGLSRRSVSANLAHAVLRGVLLNKTLPLFADNNNHGVNFIMLLEDIKAIGNNRLVLYHQKLLRSVDAHTAADTAGENNSGIHHNPHFLNRLKAYYPTKRDNKQFIYTIV